MSRKKREKDLTPSLQGTQREQRRGDAMRTQVRRGTLMIAGVLATAGAARAQEMQMPKQEQHHQMEMPPVKPEYPRMGRAQENAKGALVTLEQAQKIAGESNPTLRQAEAEIRAAKADETEVLEAEVESQRMRMTARMQENTLREEWRSLTAVIGQPDLPLTTVGGDLEKGWPEVNEEEAMEAIAKESPAVRIADAAEARAQAVLARAKRESIPDIQLRGGMEYNNELLGSAPIAKGWEGIAEVTVQIPLFNRNQGNVTAARNDIDRAGQEKKRIALTVRERAASAVDQYANARLMAVEYRDEVLPRAKKAYSLMMSKYGQMLASYPSVLS